MRAPLLWSAAVATCILCAACEASLSGMDPTTVTTSGPTFAVPLHVAATPSSPTGLRIPPEVRIFVDPVEDERQGDKALIGAYTEHVPPTAIVTVDMKPAAFVQRILDMNLSVFGATLASRSETANRRLRVKLTRLFTEGTFKYVTKVTGLVEVRDAADRVLLTRAFAGAADQLGRELNEDDYCEVTSRATFDFADNIITDPDFLRALDVGGDAPAPAPAGKQDAPDASSAAP